MFQRNPWTRQLLIIAIIVLAMGILAGCGRDKAEEATPVQQAAAEPAQPADATEAPAAEEPAVEEPTAEEAPAADEPTAVPETDEVAAEEEAAEEPAEAPVAPAGNVVAGACYHPYYPVRDGAVYRYRITNSDSEPMEMTTEYRVTGPDTFVTVQSFNNMSTEMTWRCTADGLLNTDFGMNGMEIPGVDYSLENVAGTTVPLPDQLEPGSRWQSVFSMSGAMAAEGMEVQMSIEATMDNTMVDFEDVSVPAGDYNAAKIETSTTVDMQMDMGDMGSMAMPGMDAIGMNSAMWLVDGVGMVKSTSGDGEWSSVTELIAIE